MGALSIRIYNVKRPSFIDTVPNNVLPRTIRNRITVNMEAITRKKIPKIP